VKARRTEVGLDLALVESIRELPHTALAEVGALAPFGGARELAVQEDRQVELAREPVCDRERLVVSVRAILRPQVDDRNDVKRPYARVHAAVRAHVDARDRLASTGDESVRERLRRTHEREDATPVVGVGVGVEKATAAPERSPDRLDRRSVLPLADVRHRLEQDLGRLGRGWASRTVHNLRPAVAIRPGPPLAGVRFELPGGVAQSVRAAES
jgi:hypothetical protein